MAELLRFRLGEGEAHPWRDDPSTMITRCVDESISRSMGCGYLALTRTAVRSTVDFDEIIVVLEGQFRTTSLGVTHECGAGDILWIPAGSTFTLETDSRATLFFAKYPAKTGTPPSA